MAIFFYLNKTANQSPDSSAVIMMKVYHNQFLNRVCVCSTKERIERKYWVQRKGKDGKLESGWPRKGQDSLERRLMEIELEVTDFLRSNSRNLTREALRRHFSAPKEVVMEKPKTLLEGWRGYLDRIKGGLAPRTYRSYRNSYNAMESYLRSANQLQIAPIAFDLEKYQLYRNALDERYASSNTVAKRLRHFKMVVNQGLKLGMDENEIRYRETAGIKISLCEDELCRLITLEFKSAHLPRVRDLFIVQCHTGVRVSDLFRLDRNIKGEFFEFNQTKTDNRVRIPILPIVREILVRYDYRLPKMSHQKYNEGIKKAYKQLNEKATMQIRDEGGFKDVPVWELVSSHDAVRTFITISAERGVPVPSIARITGKSVPVLLKNYLADSQRVAEREILEKWLPRPHNPVSKNCHLIEPTAK